MELFAWLTEMTVYRLDRVPETHRRKFLALIGYDPLPPRAAQTTLTFKPEPGSAPFLLPEGAEFEATDVVGQPVRFRTLRDLSVAAVALKAIQIEEVDASGVRGIHDRTQDWRDHLPIGALGLHRQPGDALYLGFTTLPIEVPISLAFRFQGPGNDREERTRILREAKAQRAACRPALPEIPCNGDTEEAGHGIDVLPPHHSARLVWEAYAGVDPDPWTLLQPAAESQRPHVGKVRDDTRALTLDGIVEINVPSTIIETVLGGVADQGDFSNGRDKPLFEPDLWPQGEPAFSLDSLGFVTGATTDRFTYRILNIGQDPFVAKMRRHNRFLHGWGTVCGLAVSPAPTPELPWRVSIGDGYALGPYGDDIYVAEPVFLNLARCGPGAVTDPCAPGQLHTPGSATGGTIFVAIKYAECLARPVRAMPAGCACEEEVCEYSRIRDSFQIECLTELPPSHQPPPGPSLCDLIAGKQLPLCPHARPSRGWCWPKSRCLPRLPRRSPRIRSTTSPSGGRFSAPQCCRSS